MAEHLRLRRSLTALASLQKALWLVDDYKLRQQIITQMAAALPGCIFCGADISSNPMSEVDSLFCTDHCIICSGIDSVMEEVYGLADAGVERTVSADVADTLRRLAERLSK